MKLHPIHNSCLQAPASSSKLSSACITMTGDPAVSITRDNADIENKIGDHIIHRTIRHDIYALSSLTFVSFSFQRRQKHHRGRFLLRAFVLALDSRIFFLQCRFVKCPVWVYCHQCRMLELCCSCRQQRHTLACLTRHLHNRMGRMAPSSRQHQQR